MSQRDLLRDPVWRAEELGCPIPDSVHAVSVALPRWEDIVGYEEKSPAVMARVKSGYPRFVIHPLVAEVGRHLGAGQPCLPLPSANAAALCAGYIRQQGGAAAQTIVRDGVHGVVVDEAGLVALKAFWQHTGLIVSTRQAEAILAAKGSVLGIDILEPGRALRRRLAGFYDCAADDVFLAPSGMAAQFAALRAVMQRRPGLPTAQLGFPYVDTLKLQEKFGPGATLLHDLDGIVNDLHALIHRQPLAACFGEIPGNPLLGSADLSRLQPLLREQGVPLVADDVVATPFNVDLSCHADLIATSLTKYMVGTGDAMGGALVCNPHSPFHAELKAIVGAQHEELLWGGDAAVLEAQARSFPERMQRHNANGLVLAGRLRAHPAVEKVWYPKWEFSEAYEAVRRPEGGWGGLITFLPRNAAVAAPRIYDHLAVCKGPSLGTVFTLACPFTLLAHYTELHWAEACGVSSHLIRLSVGLEDPEDLWQRLELALES